MKLYVNNLKSFNTGNLLLSKTTALRKEKPKVIKTENGYKIVNQKKKRLLISRTTNK